MKKIPRKNYVLLSVLFVLTIILVVCICKYTNNYKYANSLGSPLSNKVRQVNTEEELSMALTETNQIILYVGYDNDETIKKFERFLLKEISNKGLEESVIYYNISSKIDNKEYIKILKNEFTEISDQIIKAPMLIYVKNGIGIKAYNSDKSLIDLNNFREILSEYQIGN